MVRMLFRSTRSAVAVCKQEATFIRMAFWYQLALNFRVVQPSRASVDWDKLQWRWTVTFREPSGIPIFYVYSAEQMWLYYSGAIMLVRKPLNPCKTLGVVCTRHTGLYITAISMKSLKRVQHYVPMRLNLPDKDIYGKFKISAERSVGHSIVRANYQAPYDLVEASVVLGRYAEAIDAYDRAIEWCWTLRNTLTR